MKRGPRMALLGLLAMGSSLGVLAQDAPAIDAGTQVDAVWVEREFQLSYMTFTSFYSCDGLRDKVRWVLGELGVRPGFDVRTRGCARTYGPEVLPSVRIIAALPREATPEVLAEQAGDAAKRELAARVTGGSAEVIDAGAAFRARTRRVEFRSQPNGRLQDGDCELIEQLRDQVMIPLGARIVEDRVRCTPRGVTMGAVLLTVDVLEPVPEP